MSTDGKFYAFIWLLVSVVVISLAAFGTVASHLQRQAMVEMVKGGADPMAVSCAFGIGQNDVAVCTLLISKEHK